jgi:hypothetical protein
MPIKASVEIMGQIVPMSELEPDGVPGSLMDFNADAPKIIIMDCNEDDSGGIVYSADLIDVSVIDLNGPGKMQYDLEVEARIVQNGYYERFVMTRRGLGRLTLRHYKRLLN